MILLLLRTFCPERDLFHANRPEVRTVETLGDERRKRLATKMENTRE